VDVLLQQLREGAVETDATVPTSACADSVATPGRVRAAFGLAAALGADAAPLLAAELQASHQTAAIAAYRDKVGSNPHAAAAAQGLAWLGPCAAPALLALLPEAPPALQISVCDALGNLGCQACAEVPALVPALVECMGAKDWWTRRQAVEAAGRLVAVGDRSGEALLRCLADEHRIVRRAAAFAALQWASAGQHKALPAAVREALIHMLSDDSDRYNRTFAALVLERLAEDDPDARERLIASLLTSRWCPVTNSTNPF
jgi:hypothetical protein